MPTIRTVHVRTIEAPAEEMGALLDRLASPSDVLWPAPPWPRLRLDRALSVGARGGHGPIRYTMTAYQPGIRARFDFDPITGFRGSHEFLVQESGPRQCTLRHALEVRPITARAYLSWWLILRWLHDAVLEDLLDNAEREATGTVVHPAQWGPCIPLLRLMATRARWRATATRRARARTQPATSGRPVNP